jgi:hypothetical protein
VSAPAHGNQSYAQGTLDYRVDYSTNPFGGPIAMHKSQPPSAFGHQLISSHVSTAVDSHAWGLFLDRGNGQITRLVPADLLPPMVQVPATQPFVPGNGMVVLQSPRGAAPHGMWDGQSAVSFSQVGIPDDKCASVMLTYSRVIRECNPMVTAFR